jgi:hypothetical protein
MRPASVDPGEDAIHQGFLSQTTLGAHQAAST